ncbi:lipase [Haloferula helveola]|uniref:Lipase n=1 Tax=Haloferula helveola TaxID=490095 RepID=A0ABM7REQ1_9BACT|nr:lipase [Haloferula helveola]
MTVPNLPRSKRFVATSTLVIGLASSALGKEWMKSSAFEPDLVEVYKKVGDTNLDLHIFYPDSKKPEQPTPGIVMFHGGGFRKGDPGAFFYFCDYLASRGMVAISARYRLGDQLDCLKDAKSAMRYVYTNSEKFGIDPKMLAGGGGSAGGHLAAGTATSKLINEETDDLSISPAPAALVLFNPILGHNDSVNRWKPEIRKDFRPWAGVHAKMPPTLCMWGEQDKFLSVEVMKEFQKKLTDVGVRCEIEIYPGQAHSFFDNDEEWVITTVGRADSFLASLGFLQGEPTIKEWVSKR